MILEMRPVVRRSDEYGNVSFRYGNVVWSREVRGDEDLAAALLWLKEHEGFCLWIDGGPEVYRVER